MKKFLLFAAAVLAIGTMTSCSEDDGSGSALTSKSGNLISFSTTAIGSNSVSARGIATEKDNFTTRITNFQTWAYNGTNPYMGTATAGVNVTKTGSDWVYSPTQYWPVGALNFVALTPATDASITGVSTTATASAVTLNTAVTLSTNVEEQVDIMCANADAIEKTTDDGNVPYTFHHALSQVLFKGKLIGNGTITKATIASITIGNARKSGTIHYTSTNQWPEIDDQSSPARFTLEAEDLEKTVFTSETDGTDAFDLTSSKNANKKNAWFMLPQTVSADNNNVSNGAYLEICVRLEKGDVVILSENTPIQLPFPINWERNKKYTYVIEFNGSNALTPITFSVEDVDNWTAEDDADITM